MRGLKDWIWNAGIFEVYYLSTLGEFAKYKILNYARIERQVNSHVDSLILKDL